MIKKLLIVAFLISNIQANPGSAINLNDSTFKIKDSFRTPSINDISIDPNAPRTASQVMQVVRQRVPQLRHIYYKQLKNKANFEGVITLKFTIEPNGNVVNITVVSSTTQHNDFDNEIMDAISRHWHSSKIDYGNTTVTIPFTFLKKDFPFEF